MFTVDLRKKREAANLTQQQLAALTGFSQSQISRWEAAPDELTLKELKLLMGALGESQQSTTGLEIGDPYEVLRRDLKILEDCAKRAPVGAHEMAHVKGRSTPTIAKFERLISKHRRKPYVVLCGEFDAGKSRFANELMGNRYLPAGYQPETRLVTYIHHVDDRPAWVREDVWIMKAGFDPLRLEDEQHCLDHRLVAGTLETLREYGSHHGSRKSEAQDAVSALVFVPAPPLKGCILVDLPGWAHNESDSEKAHLGAQIADVLIYFSRAKGCLNGADIEHLRYRLSPACLPVFETRCEGFPVLGNFFFVASQADHSIDDLQLEGIIDDVSGRLYAELEQTFGDRVESSGRTIERAQVRERMFRLWVDTGPSGSDRASELFQSLAGCLRVELPRARRAEADAEIAAFKESARSLRKEIERAERLIAQCNQAAVEYAKIAGKEKERKKRTGQAVATVHKQFLVEKEEALEKVASIYAESIDESRLTRLIERRYDSKKDAQQFVVGHVIESMQRKIAKDCSERAKRLSEYVNEYLAGFSVGVDKGEEWSERVTPAFDVHGAFIGGMAGVATLGLLGVWAASVGNLGGYILVAQFGSVLSALGIGASGGTAGLISLVAALGGPITFGIAISVLVVTAVWWLTGESWQQRLARKLVSEFKKKKVEAKLEASVEKLWQESEALFLKCVEATEADYREYLNGLDQFAKDPAQRERAETDLRNLIEARDFFAGLPWQPMQS